jgi:nucleotide-binding universal stress UspA family protein
MILIPFGPYPVSRDALRYALAATNNFQKLDIVCFRATDKQLSSAELNLQKEELSKEVEQIASSYPDLKVSVQVRNGSYDEQINEFVESEEVKMIIAGVRKTNGLQKVMFEGKAANFLRHIPLPILLIPEAYAYSPIDTIMFATDFKPLKNDNALDPLVEIAFARNAEVRIAHVRTEKRHLHEDEVMEMHRQSALFGDEVVHSFKHIFRSTISKGIEYYLKLKGDHDLLVLVKREKGFMGRTFSKDHALEFGLHPTLPVLILDENGG